MVRVLNLHRDENLQGLELGRDGKILSDNDHRQDVVRSIGYKRDKIKINKCSCKERRLTYYCIYLRVFLPEFLTTTKSKVEMPPWWHGVSVSKYLLRPDLNPRFNPPDEPRRQKRIIIAPLFLSYEFHQNINTFSCNTTRRIDVNTL